MKHTIFATALLFITLTACSEQAPTAAATTPPPFELVTDVRQTMEWVLDPAVDVIWESAGTIITSEGSTELTPTTDEGWNAVVHASATLAEAGNLLMLPGRAIGDDWIRYAQDLTAASKLALDAAQARDADALFDAGGRVYQVCRACHNQYWPEARDD